MGATLAWFTTVALVYGAVFLLLHLGVDVGGTIGSMIGSIDHTLGRPLVGP